MELYIKYPEKHLKHAMGLAYVDAISNYKFNINSWSDDIVWGLLTEDEKLYWLDISKYSLHLYLQSEIDYYIRTFALNYKCPICNFISKDAPEDNHICGKCKVHFGYEDACNTVEEMKLRHAKLKNKYNESNNNH